MFLSSHRNTSGSLDNEECFGNTSQQAKLFRVLSNFHECFHDYIGTRRICFLSVLNKKVEMKVEILVTNKKKRKQLVFCDHRNVNSLNSSHHHCFNNSCLFRFSIEFECNSTSVLSLIPFSNSLSTFLHNRNLEHLI